MQIILAPSKTMDVSRGLPAGCHATAPAFLREATLLAGLLKAGKIEKTMTMSPALAERTRQLYLKWGNERGAAVMSYVGDVYKGFYAETLTKKDVSWAQEHLFIMSGLYGVLRPQDEISPYRLEMKAKLAVGEAKNLYEFWGDTLAKTVDAAANGVIVVLSSDEYARPVTKHSKSRLVTPVFLDNKPNSKLGTVPIYSKMMRGVLARWMIDHRVENPDDLRSFTAQGYAYDETKSTSNAPAFYREIPRPIEY